MSFIKFNYGCDESEYLVPISRVIKIIKMANSEIHIFVIDQDYPYRINSYEIVSG